MGALRSAAVLTTVSSEITQRAPDAGLQRDRSRRESALADCVSIFVWSWLVQVHGCLGLQPHAACCAGRPFPGGGTSSCAFAVFRQLLSSARLDLSACLRLRPPL